MAAHSLVAIRLRARLPRTARWMIAWLAVLTGCGFSVFEGLTDGRERRDPPANDVGGSARDDAASSDGDASNDEAPCNGDGCGGPSCENGEQDGSETGPDCGGDRCPRCAEGFGCIDRFDCETNVCGPQGICLPAACGDGVRNGSETDKDCGGDNACPRCEDGRKCNAASDCVSGVCAIVCQAPTCEDGVHNGAETGIDCGGPCAPEKPCATGVSCVVEDDCASGLCLEGLCRLPRNGTPIKVPGTIEAEHFDQGGEGVGFHDTTLDAPDPGVDLADTTDVGGGKHVTQGVAGEWLAYTIEVPADADDYNIELRAASPGREGRVRFELDGEPLGENMVIPRGADELAFTTVERNRVRLEAGVHLLRLVHLTDGVHLNWLRITRGGSPYSGTPWPVPGLIQAEDFDVGGEGVAYHATPGSNTPELYRATDVDIIECGDQGKGFNVTNAVAGDWLTYTVHVTQEADYKLELRVASSTEQTLHVEVDGQNATGPLAVPDTTDDQTYETIDGTLHLSEGIHKLRLVFDTGPVNVNWLRLQ